MTTASFTVEWYIIVGSMIFNALLSISLIIIQKLSVSSYVKNLNVSASKKTILYLNCIFISGFVCSIQCLLCHISDNFHPDFCRYGVPVCVVIYFMAKTFLYVFLIERAKSAQGISSIFPSILFDKILPIYIILYFISFSIVLLLYFRGTVYDPLVHGAFEKPGITGCIFSDGILALFFVGGSLDIINTFGLLFLFIYPLIQLIQQHKARNNSISDIENKGTSVADYEQYSAEALQLITTAKVSIIATTLCTFSCVTLLFFDATSTFSTYVWLMGNVDMTINSLSTFSMIGANRSYVSNVIFCGCAGLTCKNLLNCGYYNK